MDGITVDQLTDYLKTALASDPRTTAEWNLRTKAGEAGGNPQTGRRGAKAWYPDGAGSFYPASGDACSAAAVGSDFLRIQLWFSTGTVSSSSGSSGAAIYRHGYSWVVDLDLEKFFDRVNHDKLMGQVAKRVEDKRLLKLIRAFLNAGVMEKWTGQPQHRRHSPGRSTFATVIQPRARRTRPRVRATRTPLPAIRG